MDKVKELKIEEIEQLIEYKLLEMFGDPDSGLQLKKEFKKKLEQRLKNPSRRVLNEEVLKEFA